MLYESYDQDCRNEDFNATIIRSQSLTDNNERPSRDPNQPIIIHVDANYDFDKNKWFYGNNKDINQSEWSNQPGL